MAIATKQIASGVLATDGSGISYITISNCSDWFESRYGTGTGAANALAVAVAIEKFLVNHPGPPPTEQEVMKLHVFESDDLKKWDHVVDLTPTGGVTSARLYSFAWEYGGARKKYLRIQFAIDLDPPHTGTVPTIPYPNHDVWFEGTCWVTTYHKR